MLKIESCHAPQSLIMQSLHCTDCMTNFRIMLPGLGQRLSVVHFLTQKIISKGLISNGSDFFSVKKASYNIFI